MAVGSRRALKGTVLASFFFIPYTADVRNKSADCHLLKFSEDSAIVYLVTDGGDRESREVTQGFVEL